MEAPLPGKVKLDDETGRLAALRRYQVLDTQIERPFETIISLVEDILEVPICAVSLLDADRQWFKAQRGLEVCETSRDIALCHYAIQQEEPMVVPDTTADERFSANPLVTGEEHLRAYAGVPLVTPDGYAIGTLFAMDTQPRTFSEYDLRVLRRFARLVVDELELRLQSGADQLTGVMVHGAWMAMVKEEIQRAARNANTLCISLFDIDRFKRINDAHGRALGDQVIRSVIAACETELRAGSKLGRLGGAQFAVLFTECALDQAVVAAERCRRAIERLTLSTAEGADIEVTASFGVAPLYSYALSPEELIELADRALYQAKSNGRNRVEVGQVVPSFYPGTA